MFKIIFETDSLVATINDKRAGEDLSLDDALSLVEQGLHGLGYVWTGDLDFVGGKEDDEPSED